MRIRCQPYSLSYPASTGHYAPSRARRRRRPDFSPRVPGYVSLNSSKGSGHTDSRVGMVWGGGRFIQSFKDATVFCVFICSPSLFGFAALAVWVFHKLQAHATTGRRLLWCCKQCSSGIPASISVRSTPQSVSAV